MKALLSLLLFGAHLGSLCGSLLGDLLSATGNGLNNVQSANYLEERDTLSVTCTLPQRLLDQNFSSSDIGFSSNHYPGGRGPKTTRCIPQAMVEAVNATSAVFSKPASVEDARFFTCFVPHGNCGVENVIEVGLSDDIRVEYPVHNVTNFSCVVYDWSEMTCSWSHLVTYLYPRHLNVSVAYVVQQDTQVYACSSLTFNQCHLNLSVMYPYVFEVNVTNTKTRSQTSRAFKIDPTRKVKPSPVINLSVRPSSPHCFHLSWGYHYHELQGPRSCRIRHRALDEASIDVVASNVSSPPVFEACGYAPYSTHSFFVDCLPGKGYSGYWSDVTVQTATTQQSAPGMGPVHTPASYFSSGCHGKASTRQVHFYWKDVPEASRHGEIFGYIVKVGSNTVGFVSSSNRLSTTTSSTSSDSSGSSKNNSISSSSSSGGGGSESGLSVLLVLPCSQQTILVQVYAQNKAGLSVKPSVWEVVSDSIAVPATVRKSLAVEISLTEEGQEVASRAVWNWGNDPTGGPVTVLWCERTTEGENLCKNEISWLETDVSQKYLNFSEAILFPRNHLFGLSYRDPETNLSTSAFWTDCMFIKDAAYSIPIKKSIAGNHYDFGVITSLPISHRTCQVADWEEMHFLLISDSRPMNRGQADPMINLINCLLILLMAILMHVLMNSNLV